METHKNLPSVSEIKSQLRPLSILDRAAIILVPILMIISFFVLANAGWYLAALMSLFYLSFCTYGSCCHDLVHCNFGMSKRACNLWLSIIEVLLMRSGTTYRKTHLNHHQTYPDFEKDPEGRASYFSLIRTFLEGPIFHPKLILWTLRNGNSEDRLWIAVELFCVLAFFAAGVLLIPTYPALIIYQALVIMGAWIIPFITSYLVHVPYEKEPIRQTKLFRGLFYRVIALDHLYHLEHHLYPQIPHCRWKDLAMILNPYFEKEGLDVIRFSSPRSKDFSLN